MGVTFINGIPYGDATTDVVKIKKADWEKIPTRFSDNILYDIEDMTVNEQVIDDNNVSQQLTWSSSKIKQGLMNIPKMQHLTGTIQITSSTTLSKVANITVPKGFNIIRVYAHYANNPPTQLILGYGNTAYENLGNVVPASGMTPQDLSLTTAVKFGAPNSINVYAKYGGSGANSIGYDILNIDI